MQVIGDPMRSPPTGDAQVDDPPLGALRGPVRADVRAAAAVEHRRDAADTVPLGPLLGRSRRALEPLSRPAQRPPIVDDTAGQPQPALRGQEGISVRHEAPLGIDVRVVTTPIPEVLTYFLTPRRSQPAWSLQLATRVHQLLGYGWQRDGQPITEADVRTAIAQQSSTMEGLDLIDNSTWTAWTVGPSARSL